MCILAAPGPEQNTWPHFPYSSSDNACFCISVLCVSVCGCVAALQKHPGNAFSVGKFHLGACSSVALLAVVPSALWYSLFQVIWKNCFFFGCFPVELRSLRKVIISESNSPLVLSLSSQNALTRCLIQQ